MQLDEDPFLIDSWEEYAQGCLEAGEMWRFRKALGSYIYITNRPVEREIREYAVRRNGDFAKQRLEEIIARKKNGKG